MKVNTSQYLNFNSVQRNLKQAVQLQEQFVREMLNLQNNLIAMNVKNSLNSHTVDRYA
jgi:hypothetical protein